MYSKVLLFFFSFAFNLCIAQNNEEPLSSVDSLFEADVRFWGDSLLMGNRTPIQSYISKYQIDTCGFTSYGNSVLKSSFEGIHILSDINSNGLADTVFVVPPFNYCDEGESYCFFDQSLPRLYTNSNCCHPNNLFVVQDIDEDGMKEIGIFYSSCSSRYKSLIIYSLKNGAWKEIGISDFDVLTKNPDKVNFTKLVTKVAKNKFKICSFIEGKTIWTLVSMN